MVFQNWRTSWLRLRRMLLNGDGSVVRALESDRLGDGADYDILSYDATDQPRYIEVKTTNGAIRPRSSSAATSSIFRRRPGKRSIFTAYFNFVRPQCFTCCAATFRSSCTSNLLITALHFGGLQHDHRRFEKPQFCVSRPSAS
jgi:hypothetical protein